MNRVGNGRNTRFAVGLSAAALLLASGCAGESAVVLSAEGAPESMAGGETPAEQHGGTVAGDSLTGSEALTIVADSISMLGKDSGFAGQVVNEADRSIRVSWKGEPPSDVAKYAATAPHGVTVTIDTSAQLTRSEAMEAAERVLAEGVATIHGVSTAATNPDGSGLTIALTDPAAQDFEALTEQLAAAAGLPASLIAIDPEPTALINLPGSVESAR